MKTQKANGRKTKRIVNFINVKSFSFSEEMAKYRLTKLKSFDAHGGLSRDFLDANPSLKDEKYSSTRAGRYVVGFIGKHVSGGRWIYSTVPWGTPMLFKQAENTVYVQKNGKMIKLSAYNSQWGQFSDAKIFKALSDTYMNYYAAIHKKLFPTEWIFNDFGHVTIKYFKDLNGDFQLNKKETLHSDFLHTTQIDELTTTYNKTVSSAFAKPINLVNSHGCIHVKPDSIDELISKGYLEKGSTIEIHPYQPALMVPNTIEITNANPKKSFEVHFFPLWDKSDKNISGKGEMVVYTINKLK